MDKRHQIFVSSTYRDLTEERAAVIQAILNLEHFPAGMELFPAANDDQWTLIKQVIEQSDYYVVVVAGRYGSVSAKGVSYTEQEYDYAAEIGVPILGFVHAQPNKIEQGKGESTATARKKLADFRKKVETRMVKHFTNSDQLGGQVTTSLVREMRNNPRTGWVRGDKAMTAETEREILRLRAELAESREKQSAIIQNTQAALDHAKLAQGDDEVKIKLRVYSNQFDRWIPTVVSWNDMLAAIGPAMIDEATEGEVRQRLESCLYRGKMRQRDREAVAKVSARRIAMADANFDTIGIHFRSLGIIESGTKKRQISDSNKYLRLTALGQEKLAALKVVTRDDEDDQDDVLTAPTKIATPVKKAAAKKAPAKKAATKTASPAKKAAAKTAAPANKTV